MLTAGCLNHAYRIVEKYDEVLYGPAPEILVSETHTVIKEQLKCTECRTYLEDTEVSDSQLGRKGDRGSIPNYPYNSQKQIPRWRVSENCPLLVGGHGDIIHPV